MFCGNSQAKTGCDVKLKKFGLNRVRMALCLHVSLFFLLQTVLLSGLTGCENKTAPAASGGKAAQREKETLGTIVAVGDSLTAGQGVAEEMAYPAQLESKLRDLGYAYTVVNAGVSGETSSGALSRIEWVVASLDPDIIILETGANDGLRGIDPTLLEDNLEAVISLLQEKKIVVVLAGMKMLPNLGPDYIEAFSRIYPQLAEKYNLIFMPFFLEGVAGDPELNQKDGIHPTAAGYARMVDNLLPHVIEAIRHRSGKTP